MQEAAGTVLTGTDIQPVEELRVKVAKMKVRWDDLEEKVIGQQVKFADAISQWQSFKCKCMMVGLGGGVSVSH